MSTPLQQLSFVYDGWDGYNRSLIAAVNDLTPDQLAFRVIPEMRSVAEITRHIGSGRVEWFRRIAAPLSEDIWCEMEKRDSQLTPPLRADELVDWLDRTWAMVAATLDQWTVDDLSETYRHPYQGTVYAVSRQWTIWRIMAHDIHHGGQISELLAMQGIEPYELTLLGGHLTMPAVAD